MRPELNFFGDANRANVNPYDDLNLMARTIYNMTRSHHDQVLARQAQQISMINAQIQFTHHPAGLRRFQPAPPAFRAQANMGVYYGGDHFSVWNGVHSDYPYHMMMQKPIPFGEENDFGLGMMTRNFLGALEAARNRNHANQALRLGSPEQITVSDPIVEGEPENEEEAVSVGEGMDLDLKL